MPVRAIPAPVTPVPLPALVGEDVVVAGVLLTLVPVRPFVPRVGPRVAVLPLVVRPRPVRGAA